MSIICHECGYTVAAQSDHCPDCGSVKLGSLRDGPVWNIIQAHGGRASLLEIQERVGLKAHEILARIRPATEAGLVRKFVEHERIMLELTTR